MKGKKYIPYFKDIDSLKENFIGKTLYVVNNFKLYLKLDHNTSIDKTIYDEVISSFTITGVNRYPTKYDEICYTHGRIVFDTDRKYLLNNLISERHLVDNLGEDTDGIFFTYEEAKKRVDNRLKRKRDSLMRKYSDVDGDIELLNNINEILK